MATRRDVLAWTLGAAWAAGGCSVGSGGWTTRLVKPPAGLELDPPVPEDLYWLRVMLAELPATTSDGRQWDETGKPDPYFVIRVDDREIMRSKPENDQLRPTWPEGPRGNVRLLAESRARFEVFDSDAVDDGLMGSGAFSAPTAAQLRAGSFEVDLGAGARAKLVVERAHALFGLGFNYVLSQQTCVVEKLLRHSPASRAGMQHADEILKIDGSSVASMAPSAIRSVFNSVPSTGIKVVVRHR